MKLRLTKTPAMLFSKKLANISIIQLIEKDLDRLGSLDGDAVKKITAKKNYLYQSYIVHLVAGWQEFNVELVEYSFSILEKKSGSSDMNEIARRRIDDLLKKFNTPSEQNVNALYKDAFGVLGVSKSWVFDGINNKTSSNILKNVLTARHQVAHKGVSIGELNYKVNFENMEIIYKIACATEQHVFSSLSID
ncbi:hypothetical protein ACTZGI_04920 [Rahnella aceris]|uniref:hypothetical protein n=1 Tax=Rahnella sp. (strain Y9602) TaxID=2703885 RepID=UPI003FD3A59F